MKIALSCLSSEYTSCEVNLLKAEEAIREAFIQSCDLIAFPEMGITGYGKEAPKAAVICDAASVLSDASERYALALLYGHVRKEGDEWYNCAVLTDDKGTEQYVYRKIHPFSFARENEYITEGKEAGVAEFQGHPLGIAICYDLRFGELYRKIARTAPVVITISAWPESRDIHFRTLLQCRAIDHQIYTVGVNQSGVSPAGEKYGGNPYVFDPRGHEIPLTQIGEHLFMVDIEVEKAYEVRSLFPIRRDLKTDLYRSWYDEMKES